MELLDALNAARAARGKSPLAPDPRLEAAAQAHAEFMARAGKLADMEEDIGDGTVWGRVLAQDYPYSKLSEITARSNLPGNAADLIGLYLNHPGATRLILDDWAHFGGGRADAEGELMCRYWCGIFASPPDRDSHPQLFGRPVTAPG
jgi:uncharacterized protein YkwD